MARKKITEETRKALTTLNLMLDYALTHQLIEQNPARVLKPKDFSASASRLRKRFLTLLELRKLWICLDESMNPITATAIKLLILTGARRGEVAAVRWDEIDFTAGTWIIPAEKTKNGQEHIIYLSRLAKKLLQDMQKNNINSDFIFDTGLNSRGHIHTDALTRAIRRLMIKENQNLDSPEPPLRDMELFTTHDLRRSAATGWGMHLKTLPHVIELMLNHKPVNKLVERYQRAPYSDEQKEAWLKWGELVENQIANAYQNIIPLRKINNY